MTATASRSVAFYVTHALHCLHKYAKWWLLTAAPCVNQMAAAKQLEALEQQLQCRQVHAAHAAALAAAAEQDLADMRSQIADLENEVKVRGCRLSCY